MLLREKGLGSVRVGTVDDYQGQEEKIIFLSTVLSRYAGLSACSSEHTIFILILLCWSDMVRIL